jgi:hypothetical protein
LHGGFYQVRLVINAAHDGFQINRGMTDARSREALAEG